MNELILTVFKEALFARLMPVYNEVSIAAALRLSPEEYPMLAVAAGLGALLAYVILYVLGTRMCRLPERVSNEAQRARIATMEPVARYWLPFLLVLAPTPLGTVMLLAAGFFAIRAWLVTLVVCAAEVAWRVLPLVQS